MKRVTLFFVVLALIAGFTGCGKKVDVTGPMKIAYEMKGEQSGTMEMLSNKGNFKIDISGINNGQKIEASVFVKDKDNNVYMVMNMLGQKVGLKYDISKDKEAKEFSKFTNMKETLKDYKKEGTEDVLGYKCDIYKKDKESISVYAEAIHLKMVSDKLTYTATKFETDIKVDEKSFDPPKDIKFMTMEDFGKEMMKGLDKGLDELGKDKNIPDEDKQP